MKIKVTRKGITENGLELNVGDECEYLFHLPHGNIRVKINGNMDTANSKCFDL